MINPPQTTDHNIEIYASPNGFTPSVWAYHPSDGWILIERADTPCATLVEALNQAQAIWDKRQRELSESDD